VKTETPKQIPSTSNIEGIKLVKNSTVFRSGGFIYAIHYGTVIFQHELVTGKTLIDLSWSITSNRLINRCLNYYGLSKKDAKDTHIKKDVIQEIVYNV